MGTLLENYEVLPKEVKKIILKLNDDCDYDDLSNAVEKLKPLGFTFDFYLDAVPYNLVNIEFYNFIEQSLKDGKIQRPDDCEDDDDIETLVNTVLLHEYVILENGVKIDITLDMLLGVEKIFN